MGIGESTSENRVEEAVKKALNNPLLDVKYNGAQGALIHITGGPDMTLQDASRAAELITSNLDDDANVIWGARIEDNMTGKLRIMSIITGVKSPYIVGPSSNNNSLNNSNTQNITSDALGIKLVRDISHNIARIEKHKINNEMKKLCVYRKGATYLADDKIAVVPGSMGTASYLVSKSINAEELSFSSTAHGAGRIMSRKKAKKSLNEKDIRKKLADKNIIVHNASISGFIEEAPEAYKDIEEVIKTTTKLKITNNIARLRPILGIKG